MLRQLFSGIMLLSFLGTTTLFAQSYQIDTEASSIGWTGKKIVGEHSGTIGIKSGSLNQDGKNFKGSFVIDMSTIAVTDLQGEMAANLAGHLGGEDFFDVAKHPEATFEITSATAKVGNSYDVTGILTMKGVSNTIEFPANISTEKGMLKADAKLSIDRTKWGIKYGSSSYFKGLGDKAIKNEFDLVLAIAGAASVAETSSTSPTTRPAQVVKEEVEEETIVEEIVEEVEEEVELAPPAMPPKTVGASSSRPVGASSSRAASVKGYDLTKESTIAWRGDKIGGSHAGTIALKSSDLKPDGTGSFVIDMETITVTDLQGEMAANLAGHLSGEDFFDVAKHPEATFEITGLYPAKGEGITHAVTGLLTIKGITNTINFPAYITMTDNSFAAKAKFKIDRTKWDIKYGSSSFFKGLGDKVIYDHIYFDLDLKGAK